MIDLSFDQYTHVHSVYQQPLVVIRDSFHFNHAIFVDAGIYFDDLSG